MAECNMESDKDSNHVKNIRKRFETMPEKPLDCHSRLQYDLNILRMQSVKQKKQQFEKEHGSGTAVTPTGYRHSWKEKRPASTTDAQKRIDYKRSLTEGSLTEEVDIFGTTTLSDDGYCLEVIKKVDIWGISVVLNKISLQLTRVDLLEKERGTSGINASFDYKTNSPGISNSPINNCSDKSDTFEPSDSYRDSHVNRLNTNTGEDFHSYTKPDSFEAESSKKYDTDSDNYSDTSDADNTLNDSDGLDTYEREANGDFISNSKQVDSCTYETNSKDNLDSDDSSKDVKSELKSDNCSDDTNSNLDKVGTFEDSKDLASRIRIGGDSDSCDDNESDKPKSDLFDDLTYNSMTSSSERDMFTTQTKDNNADKNNTFSDTHTNDFLTDDNAIITYTDTQRNAGLEETYPVDDKVKFVINELLDTERTYMEGLHHVVQDYMVYFRGEEFKHIARTIWDVFGNIEQIYRRTTTFYRKLMDCSYNIDKIAQTFTDNEDLFDLYTEYIRNKSKSQYYLSEIFLDIIKERHLELRTLTQLEPYLLTPFQRLPRYIMLAENLQARLNKKFQQCASLDGAIRMLKYKMDLSSTLVAAESIDKSPIDLTAHGLFIMEDTFNIKNKYVSQVFLFEEVIVFTTKCKQEWKQYLYMDRIHTPDLEMVSLDSNKLNLYFKNFTKWKKSGDNKYSFELQAENENVKQNWLKIVRDILWKQVVDANDKNKAAHK